MKPVDLSQWQRLAPLALVAAVIAGWINFVRRNIFAFAGAGAGLSYVGSIGTRGLVLSMIGLLLASLLGTVVYYRRFRFRVDRDALRVRRGLFEIRDMRVRFARVQNVGFSQPFYFRPFGLVRFLVQTPGSQGDEINLPGIRLEVAQALRDRMALASDLMPEETPGAGNLVADELPGALFSAGAGRLFLHGLVSNQVWVLAGAMGYLASNLGAELANLIEPSGSGLVSTSLSAGWLVLLMAVVVSVSLIVLFALSGALSIVRFHGFVLRDANRRFVASGGLLDRREQTIRHSKLTGLAIAQSFLGRLFGMYAMTLQQTNAGALQNEQDARRIIVPGLRRKDLALVEHLMPGLEESEVLWPVSRRLRTWLWTRPGLVLLAVALTAGLMLELPLWLPPVAMFLYLLLAQRIWRGRGWRVAGDFCHVQRGIFGRKHEVFRLDMVQQAVIGQSPYQRRHDLATLRMLLPHGWISMPFIPLAEADDLINRTVWRVETAQHHRV